MSVLFLAAVDPGSVAYKTEALIAAGILILAAILIPIVFVIASILSFATKKRAWIVTAVLSGLITMGIVGLSVVGYRIATAKASTGKSMRFLDGKVEITLPSNWQMLSSLNENASLQAGNLLREEYLIVISEPKKDFDGSLTGYAKLTSSAILNSLEHGEISGAQELKINGMPAVRYTMSGRIDNLDVDYIHTSFEGSDYFHQVLGWTLKAKHDEAFPILLEAVSTFRESAETAADKPAASVEGP